MCPRAVYSNKTSDFIVDSLVEWFHNLNESEQLSITLIQIKIENGPESSGVRTQFLKRMTEFAKAIGKSIQLLYYPPYHSKYNPIERCCVILQLNCNLGLLTDTKTMLKWAKTMTFQCLHPIISLTKKFYKKGISLTKKAMRKIEAKIDRNPSLPKWDIYILPD
ncbi:MAG TPA: hypothetical protein DCM38_05975 [Gammaproteobacteria bacterium]|nr:hypothetical protein [Gammaproteobacteria bacterium]